MNKEFKAHLLYIFYFMKPFWFVLLLPVAKGVIQYIKNKKTSGILPLETLAVILILLYAFAEVKAFSVSVNNGRMLIKSGFLLKTMKYTPCIHTFNCFFHNLFRSFHTLHATTPASAAFHFSKISP